MSETVISCVALVFSIVSFVFSLISFIIATSRERKKDTLEAYNRLQEQVLDKLNQYTPADARAIAEDDRSEKFKELGVYAARIEHFCTGVSTKIYDLKVLYELGHGYFDRGMMERIEPIIAKKNSYSTHDYYANTHKILAQMAEITERQENRDNRERNEGR